MRSAICVFLCVAPAGRANADCRPRRIAFIGDSIVLGVDDSAGGFPKRIETMLQASPETFTTVLNRGLAGSLTGTWIAPPSKVAWERFVQIHPDLSGTPRTGASLAEAVAQLDQPLDAIVILLGVNDRILYSRSVAQVAANLHTLQESLRRFADVVLVSTLLPSINKVGQAAIAQMNVAIRAEFPDRLPLGDSFQAVPNWSAMVERGVHPTAPGNAVLARIAASELLARGLTGPLSRPPADGCRCFGPDREHPLALCLPAGF